MSSGEHYSFSQLNMLLRCGEQYRRRYVMGERIPPSGNLVRGKCCHKTCEVNYDRKIKMGEYGSPEEMADLFATEWNTNKYDIAYTPEELEGRSISVVEGTFKDQGVRMVKEYHGTFAPTVVPRKTEEKFTVEFEEDIPPLVGILDLIDDRDVVIDNKFVGKSPVMDDIASDAQMTMYDFGFRVAEKRKPAALKKAFCVALKTSTKMVVQEAPPRDDDTIHRMLQRLKTAHGAIKAGNFLPAANGAWWCSKRFCGYWTTCKVRP